MKLPDMICIAIAESSPIVRNGLTALLRRLPDVHVQITEITSKEALQHCMDGHQPHLLVINPQFEGWFDIDAFKEAYPSSETKLVAMVYGVVNTSSLKGYDESFGLFDDVDLLATKIAGLLNVQDEEEEEDGQGALSQREKEIIRCVVKGMTNKEIAEQLFLSIHTVITHRRNIARKLEIHSVAGLTIYAIVNKLVELKDVKKHNL